MARGVSAAVAASFVHHKDQKICSGIAYEVNTALPCSHAGLQYTMLTKGGTLEFDC